MRKGFHSIETKWARKEKPHRQSRSRNGIERSVRGRLHFSTFAIKLVESRIFVITPTMYKLVILLNNGHVSENPKV